MTIHRSWLTSLAVVAMAAGIGVAGPAVGLAAALEGPQRSAAGSLTWPGPPATAADWPQLQGGAAHQGWNKAENTLTPGTVSHLHVAWSSAGAYFGPPSAVGQRVFSSTLGGVIAVKSSSGAVVWEDKISDLGTDATPAYGHGILVVPARPQTGRTTTTVYGLDARTGDVLWVSHIKGVVYTSATVSGNTIFLSADRGKNGSIVALSLATGRVKWTWNAPPSVQAGAAPPAVGRDTVFVTLERGAVVVALNARTGAVRWTRRFEVQGGGVQDSDTAVVLGRRVYVADTTSGIVYCLRDTTGQTIWTYTPPGATHGSGGITATKTGVLDVVTGGPAAVVALSPKDGSEIWNISASVVDTPTVAGDVVYVPELGAVSYELDAYALSDGSALTRVDVPDYDSPVVSRGKVFVVGAPNTPSGGPHLSMLDLTTTQRNSSR